MWNLFKKSKEEQIEKNESVIDIEELENMRAKANAEAVKVYTKIYCLFKEHINELKKGDNFILLRENNTEIDNKLINKSIYYNHVEFYNRIPDLLVDFDLRKYYIYTIKITHDDIIELYDIRFRVTPSRIQINNGNEICVSILGIDKNIYKII